MTEDEVQLTAARPDQQNRLIVKCWERGGKLVCRWEGEEIITETVWQMDTRLDALGAFAPRSLYLMDEEPNS